MLMVTLGLAGSGYRSTRNPFGKSYSATPPSEAFFSTPGGKVWHRAELANRTAAAMASLDMMLFLIAQSGRPALNRRRSGELSSGPPMLRVWRSDYKGAADRKDGR